MGKGRRRGKFSGKSVLKRIENEAAEQQKQKRPFTQHKRDIEPIYKPLSKVIGYGAFNKGVLDGRM